MRGLTCEGDGYDSTLTGQNLGLVELGDVTKKLGTGSLLAIDE